jgi:hypothetical protein
MGGLGRIVRRLRYGAPIVVVSGLPRSGTSLMMQMLQAGGMELVTDRVREPDASNPKGYFELEAVKSLDKRTPPDWLEGARGKAVKIVSSLVRWLPERYDYRVIFMQRDLGEVMASQNAMLAARGVPPDTSQDRAVEAHYRAHVADTLRLLSRRRNCMTLVVDHRDALTRPAETAQRVARFLELPLDLERMAAVADPTLYRNRRAAPGA